MSEKSIKSVRRVFEILELFDKERRPLTANEVAKRLDYPLTSAHALLKSMHELGYADFYPPNWTYTPSPNFSALLDWVQDFLDRDTNLLNFMTALSHDTRETINLSRRIDTQVKIVHGIEGLHTVGISVKIGTLMPITRSLTGIVSLSCLNETERTALFQRLEAGDIDQASNVDRALIDEVFSELETRGTVAKCDVFIQGIGAVCLPIKTTNQGTLVIGIVGPSDRIREQEKEHRRTLKRLVSEYQVDSLYKLRNPRQ